MKAATDKFWWVLLVVGLLPLLLLGADIATDRLGANPVQAVHIRLGDWALRFLCLTLAVTPLQTLSQWRGMADYRQLLGLYSWFYATLHVLAYLGADHNWQWRMIADDILESPYIWFGLLSYLILLALATTSSKWAKKYLGKQWKTLHRSIYTASIAAVIHYFWQLKGNLAEPLFYALIVSMLLGFRILVWLKDRNRMMIPPSRKSRHESAPS